MGEEEQLNLQAKQGRGHPLVDMRIVGDDGREQPWDGKSFGNLQVRGPHVVRAYFKVRLPPQVSALLFAQKVETRCQNS